VEGTAIGDVTVAHGFSSRGHTKSREVNGFRCFEGRPPGPAAETLRGGEHGRMPIGRRLGTDYRVADSL
jgi:hypothetical protein